MSLAESKQVCETLWNVNPLVLFRPRFSTLNICESDNVNAFMRAFLLSLLFGLSLSVMFKSIGMLALVMVVLFFLYYKWLTAKIYVFSKTAVREPFEGAEIRPDLPTPNAFPTPPSSKGENYVTSPGVAVSTLPTARNPFMNVLLDEIQYNPTRPAADDVSSYQNAKALDDFFRTEWFNDPTDVFGRNQGQRQFYTMPSTSVPNDQGSYQNWLYLIPGKTCKEGGRDACVPGTNGGVVPWLSQPN